MNPTQAPRPAPRSAPPPAIVYLGAAQPGLRLEPPAPRPHDDLRLLRLLTRGSFDGDIELPGDERQGYSVHLSYGPGVMMMTLCGPADSDGQRPRLLSMAAANGERDSGAWNALVHTLTVLSAVDPGPIRRHGRPSQPWVAVLPLRALAEDERAQAWAQDMALRTGRLWLTSVYPSDTPAEALLFAAGTA